MLLFVVIIAKVGNIHTVLFLVSVAMLLLFSLIVHACLALPLCLVFPLFFMYASSTCLAFPLFFMYANSLLQKKHDNKKRSK